MKILDSYKKIAKEFIKEAAWDRKFGEPLPTLSSVMKEAEVDDDKIIKYKDKEGESQEMTAGAAKKQPEDHPAKIEYEKMKDKGDSGDKPSGKALGGSDFERDFDDKGDEPKGISKDDEDENRKEEAESALTDIRGIDFDEFEQGPEGYDMMMNALENLEGSSITRDEEFKNLVDDLETNQDTESALAIKDYLEKVFDDKEDADDEPKDEPKGDEEPKKLSSDEIDKKVDDLGKEIFSIYHTGMSDQDKERYIDGLQKQIDDLKSQKESIKVIDGKKYKAIKESKEPTKSTIHPFKKTYKKIGGK